MNFTCVKKVIFGNLSKKVLKIFLVICYSISTYADVTEAPIIIFGFIGQYRLNLLMGYFICIYTVNFKNILSE